MGHAIEDFAKHEDNVALKSINSRFKIYLEEAYYAQMS